MTTIEADRFGRLPDGREVDRYTLTNRRGTEVRLSSLGATVTSCRVRDRDGHHANVVIGYDDPAEYLADTHCIGATVGRYANRIANARFSLDGIDYRLDANDDAGHHLHGGGHGFQHRIWLASIDRYIGDRDNAVSFYLTSADGDQGYPGTLSLRVSFTLDEQDGLHIEYAARTDRTTVVNPTHHGYFNLAADPAALNDHELRVMASQYTPVDAHGIPTGEIADVDGTPLDFRAGRRLGDAIDAAMLSARGGYDHNLVLNKHAGDYRLAAILSHAGSGRRMSVITTEPGLQLYTANQLDTSNEGYGPRSAVCLETQHYPDSPNRPQFPSVVLLPGQLFRSKTSYRFDTFAAPHGADTGSGKPAETPLARRAAASPAMPGSDQSS